MSDVTDLINSFSPEEIERINNEQLDEAEKDYIIFKKDLQQSVCTFCTKDINTFDLDTPCLHWLIRPNNLKKKAFEKLFKADFGYYRMTSYMRWIANTEEPLVNINNLKEDMTKSKKLELTIKYKNIEWSLNCSNSDFVGHSGTYSNFPHFHLQMTIDGNTFIRYGEFHIPFNDEDLWTFKALEESPEKFGLIETVGAGMQEILDSVPPNELLDLMQATDDSEKAPYHLQTFMEAPKGKTISGDEIVKLINESKETGIPIAKLARKLDAKVTTIISPGDGVPELKKRSPVRS